MFAADQRQRQQQGGQELARDVAAHADRRGRGQAPASRSRQAQGRVARRAQFLDLAAQRPQRIDEVPNRPLVHARHARELEAPALGCGEQGQRRRQRPHRGAGVAQEELRFVDHQAPAQAGDVQHAAVATQAAAQRGQGIEHHARVVAVEQVVDGGRPAGQTGEQQHAVGDALGAGQAHAAGGTAERRQVEERNAVHLVRRAIRTAPGRVAPRPGARPGTWPPPFSSCPCQARVAHPSASRRGLRPGPVSGPPAHRRCLRA